MKILLSLLLMMVLMFMYNYLSKKILNINNWQSAKVLGILLMPLVAIATPILVLIAGMWLNPATYVDPKCGMPELSFSLICWVIGLPLSIVLQITFNKEFYKTASAAKIS